MTESPSVSPSSNAFSAFLERIGRLMPSSPLQLFMLLLAWLVLHFTLRLSITDVIGVDDVEQQIFGQVLALGYHPKQPPLYTWLLYGLQSLAGPGLLAAMILKYAHLAAFLAIYWGLVRRLLVSTSHQIATMLSLLLIFQYAWQVHAGFTHSLTLLVTSALTLLSLLRLVDRQSLTDYILFGAAIGLGFLSKYNYGLALLALLLAAWSLPDFRHVLKHPFMLASLATAAAILAAPLWWLLSDGQHVSGAMALQAKETTDMAAALMARLRGLADLGGAVLGYLSPLIVVLALPLWRSRRNLAGTRKQAHRLTGRFLAFSIGLMVMLVLLTGFEGIKARWLHPLLFVAPIFLMRRIERSHHAWTAAIKGSFVLAVLGFSLLVPVMRVVEFEVGPPFCKHCRPSWPQSALAIQLWQDMPAPAGLIFAMDDHLAGNLISRIPDSRVITPHYDFFRPVDDIRHQATASDRPFHCIAIWNRDKAGDALPRRLAAQMQSLDIHLPDNPVFRDIDKANMIQQDRIHRWRWIWLLDCLGQ